MFVSPEALETGRGGVPLGLRIAVGGGQPAGDTARPTGFRQQIALRWHQLQLHLATRDWTTDLAEDIGSRRWFRGLGTLLGLSAAALALVPDFSAFASPQAMPDQALKRGKAPALAGQPAEAPEPAVLRLSAALAAGDNLEQMLRRAGAAPTDAARVSALVSSQFAPTGLPPETAAQIVLGRRPGPDLARPLDALVLWPRLDLQLEVARTAAGFDLRSRRLAVDQTPLRIRGTIGEGLYRSARAAGAPIEAIQQYLQVLDRHLSLDTAIEPGDTFDLIVSFKRSESGRTEVGELLFAGVERDGRAKAQLLRWGEDGQFFEASGMGAQRTGLIMPVFGRITSGFGARRHPILGFTRMHGGIDFGAPSGAPIYAVGDATVAFAGWGGGHGNHVKLDHGGGWGTGYSHMSQIAVTPGSRVRAGQVIGYVGSTGLSTGPHLHYELYRNGAKVDPMSVRFTVSNQIDARELAAFRARLAALKSVAPGAALRPLARRD